MAATRDGLLPYGDLTTQPPGPVLSPYTSFASMLKSKLPDVGTTIFTVMSQLAIEHQAVNLGQGFPDFSTDSRLIDLVTEAMKAGHNQYPHMAGVPALRRVIADKTEALYGHAYNPDTEVTVTSGATEALMVAIQCSVHPGDEVVVLEPCYDSYLSAVTLAGGRVVPVPLSPPNAAAGLLHYHVDWDRVRAAITPRTRLLIINSPHNPTGAILHDADLDALEKIVADTGVILVSDEVYEHIVFDGASHASLSRRPALAARSFVISSFGKTFHTTGWKIGYCLAPAALTAEFRKVHQFVVFTVPSPMQYAIAEYLRDPLPYMNLPSFYQAKRDRLANGLARTRFDVLPAAGTFFLLARYDRISDLPELEFARQLTIEHKVTVIPVAAFYAQPQAPESNRHTVRFCFAKQDATLDLAVERLAAL